MKLTELIIKVNSIVKPISDMKVEIRDVRKFSLTSFTFFQGKDIAANFSHDPTYYNGGKKRIRVFNVRDNNIKNDSKGLMKYLKILEERAIIETLMK